MPRQDPQEMRPLTARRSPSQQRGRDTVSRLLDATANLLEEQGFEALTTNKIAARAEVNIASLYKYFPNKYAVVRALAERDRERQMELIGQAFEGWAGDWRVALDRGVDAFMRFLLSEPGGAELAAAIRSSPALRDLDATATPQFVELLSAQLADSGSGRVDRKRVAAIAKVIVEASSAVLVAARAARPAERKRLVAELKDLLLLYLEARMDVTRS